MRDILYTVWKVAGAVAFIYIMGTLGQVAGFTALHGESPWHAARPLGEVVQPR